MIYRPGPRRVLDGGTLAADFLGGTFLGAVARLEGQAEEMQRSALSADAAARSYVRLFQQLVFDGWGRQDVAAALTDVELARFGNAWQAGLRLAVGGSVAALGVMASAARTAGTATVAVWVNGAATELAATLDDTDTLAALETADGGATFAAGEEISLRLTTSGWAPVTADLQAWIVVSLDV
jgi:hypothetical protein